MTPAKSQHIRFGILTARHEHEPWRLTNDQANYLEGCELVGWRKGDSVRAYRRERDNIERRNQWRSTTKTIT